MKKTTKRILGALAILAAFAFISCQSDDGGNSDSDSPKVEQSGTTDEGGTGSDSSNTDTPDVELPGTPGGTSNPNDIFAGKTFYDEDEKKFRKFDFSDDGTVIASYNEANRLSDQPVWEKGIEYYYSIGDDNTLNLKGKSVYVDEKPYSYSEAVELINSWNEDYFLEDLKDDWYADDFDFTTESGLLDCIKYALPEKGIFLDKDINCQTALNKYVEYRKKQLKEYLTFDFFSVLKLKFTKNEDGTISIDVPDSATFLEILSLYNSPFDISEFSDDHYNIEIWSKTGGSFWSKYDGGTKTISSNIYAVDESKIYGVVKPDTYTKSDPYTEKVEFTYTTEETGENTKVKITYAENTYTLTHCKYDFKFYLAE